MAVTNECTKEHVWEAEKTCKYTTGTVWGTKDGKNGGAGPQSQPYRRVSLKRICRAQTRSDVVYASV
jgi:hypothetical protein